MRPRTGRRPAMLDRAQQRRHKPDYALVLISVVLLVIGLIIVYAISPGLTAQQGVSDNYYVSKQLIAVVLGIVGFLVAANTRLAALKQASKPLVVAAIIAAAAVQLFGEEVNGAYRWVQIGGLSFQAVELIKFALVVWLAGFLAERVADNSLNDWHKTIKPLFAVLAGLSLVVAVFQSDFGSATVIVAMMSAMAFVGGLSIKRVFQVAGVVAVAGALLLMIGPGYRRDRLATFLQPEQDCLGSGYQTCQALIAIGSGGMFGRDIGGSVQAYGYLPESANDSIFAIYGEMFGFIGTVVLIGLFAALFARMKQIMERAPDTHSRLMVAGVLAWLSTQTLINVGAMIGLLPLKGITLPFISYGGTSIVFVTAAVGLVFNISRYTTYTAEGMELRERTADRKRPYSIQRPRETSRYA